ncbi:hypothetical protein JD844_012708, partial [Phrynosoma platyrhinos]
MRTWSEVLKLQVPSQGSPEKKTSAAVDGQYALSVVQQDRSSPTDDAGMSENVEDQMFRSVEGQAASDEEEEKWTGDQQYQLAEVKKLLARLPCCSNGYVSRRNLCDDTVIKLGHISKECHKNTIVEIVKQLSVLTEELEMKGKEVKTLDTNMEKVNGLVIYLLGRVAEDWLASKASCCYKFRKGTTCCSILSVPTAVLKLIHIMRQVVNRKIQFFKFSDTLCTLDKTKGSLLGELQQKVEETELLKMELQMLEAERVKLSLVEEKLLDVLQLLQQLRDL